MTVVPITNAFYMTCTIWRLQTKDTQVLVSLHRTKGGAEKAKDSSLFTRDECEIVQIVFYDNIVELDGKYYTLGNIVHD